MMLARALSTAAVVVYLVAGTTAEAQSKGTPAEFPPETFTGAQYVDSTGCVFVRAGFDGAVVWVPRMTRARKQVCGVRPSIAEAPEPSLPVVADPPAAARTAEAAPARPAPRVVKRRAATAATPKTVTREVSSGKPAPRNAAGRPVATVAGPAARRGGKVIYRVIRKGTPPEAAPLRTDRPTASQVVAAADPSQKRVRSGRIYTRNGKTVVVLSRREAAGARPAASRVVAATSGAVPVRTPRGYKRVWTDGRLNPLRGERSPAGREQMALLWTQDVPRRLIDVRTGRDVTALRREMVYPYTSYAEQQRDLGHPATTTSASSKSVALPKPAAPAGRVVKKVIRRTSRGETGSVSAKSTRQPRRMAAAETRAVAAAAGRYVQVGTFGEAGNARRTAARLQGAGLPVRIQSVTRSGQAMTIVMAGPLAGNALDSGLRKARALGFGDAFVR